MVIMRVMVIMMMAVTVRSMVMIMYDNDSCYDEVYAS